MRNLKRVLSLAMASAMLFSMMVIGAGAADYKDQNSISYKEAVAVMSGVGVFQGADGSFNATGVLTRESAAKIITYMMMGKEAADALATSSAPFTDVAATRWSAGSIGYCVANKIISGDGQGHFYPELTVTGSAFAKMLLGALGYSAEIENLTGTGWELNVAKLVVRAELSKDLSSVLSKEMTREQAAQMAFNAMKAETVTYSGGGNITAGSDVNINLGYTRTDSGKTFAKQNFSKLEGKGRADDFGRPGTQWKFGTTDLGTFGSAPAVSFTEETKEADVKSELSGYDLDATNGVTPTMNAANSTPVAVKNWADIAALTKNGRAVEIYTTKGESGTEKISSIVVNDTYLTTVATINTVNKSVNLKTSMGAVFTSVTNEDQSVLYNALADLGKDAKVLIICDKSGKVLSVAKPESTSGTYTAKGSSNERTVGGTKYKQSYLIDENKFVSYGTNYTIYLDTYGYIIGAEEEAASEAKTAYVKNVDYQGSASSGMTYLAQLVFHDGTQEWVEVSKVDSTSKFDKFADYKTALGVVGENASLFVEYSVKSDGTYNLTTLVKKDAVGTGGTLTTPPTADSYYTFDTLPIKKGAASFFDSSSTTTAIQGSSKTVFLIENKSTASSSTTYTAYTGVKNVPNMTDASGIILVPKNTRTASLVVVTTKKNATDASALVYIIKDTGSHYDETLKDTVFTYDAIVKGEVTTLTTTTDKDSAKVELLKGLYSVGYDTNNFATELETVVTSGEGKNDLVAEEKFVTLDNGTISGHTSDTDKTATNAYVTADNFKAFIVDKDNKAAEIDAEDVNYYLTQEKAYVIMDSDKEFATTLIIVQ